MIRFVCRFAEWRRKHLTHWGNEKKSKKTQGTADDDDDEGWEKEFAYLDVSSPFTCIMKSLSKEGGEEGKRVEETEREEEEPSRDLPECCTSDAAL